MYKHRTLCLNYYGSQLFFLFVPLFAFIKIWISFRMDMGNGGHDCLQFILPISDKLPTTSTILTIFSNSIFVLVKFMGYPNVFSERIIIFYAIENRKLGVIYFLF